MQDPKSELGKTLSLGLQRDLSPSSLLSEGHREVTVVNPYADWPIDVPLPILDPLTFIHAATEHLIPAPAEFETKMEDQEKVMAEEEANNFAKEWLSEVQCQGEISNVTCKFRNLYSEHGKLFVYVLHDAYVPPTLLGLRTLPRFHSDGVVAVRRFRDVNALAKFLQKKWSGKCRN